MPTTLTRQQLYDLVWSRPRTALAKELGVSDVAINKHCVAAKVPAPVAGYWARLAAGGAVFRAPLPPRLPGQSDTVVIGRDVHWHGHYQANLGDLAEAPTFTEDIEQQVADAVKAIGRVVASRDLQSPDRALAKVLAAEERRRAKHAANGWSMDKPYFDEPMYQRQLRIFNGIARALGPLYGRQEVRTESEWAQNIGTTYQLSLHLDFGPVSMNLVFFEPTVARGRDRKKVVSTTLSVGSERAHAGVQEWADSDGQKLEQQLTGIVEQLVRRAEVTLRAAAQSQYEYRLKLREEERAAEEARKREAEAKRLAALEAKRVKVRDEVVEVARRRRMAEDIRATVEALQAHPDANSEIRARFLAWSERALEVAANIDPMCNPLESVLASFDLD